MERLGLVGLPNSGKSSLFNALTGASTVVAAAPVLDHRDHGRRSRTCPTSGSTSSGKMSNSKKLVYTGFEIVDIAALVKGASTGEGLGNRVPRLAPRLRRHPLRAAGVRGPVGARRHRPRGRPRHARARAGARRPGVGRGPARTASSGRRRATSRSAGEIAALERAAAVLGDGTPLYRSDLTDDERALLAPAFLLTDKPVLVVVNIGEDQLDTVDDAGRAGGRRRRRARRVPAARGRGGAARPRGARRAARRPRARRGRRAPRRPRRVPPARPAHVPHHRRHRVARVDVPRRRQGARVRGRDPLRPAARLHPGRGDLLARSCSTSARGRRPRSRASCASRGRTTRSSTATCSRSASTCDGAAAMSWLVRDGDVLAAAEVGRHRARPAARAARPRRVRRRARAAPVPPRAHRRHAVPDRRRVLRRDGRRAAHVRRCAPWRVSPVVRRAAFVIEAEAGRVRPLAARGRATASSSRA